MKNKPQKKAIIIGAGPAGLTAAYELLKRTDVIPVVIEQDSQVGGISRTVNYNGNRIDIGGHRFFSKSETVMKWWQEILPVETEGQKEVEISYQNKQSSFKPASNKEKSKDAVLLIRRRISRIFYLRKFFDYPVSLNINTIKNLGIFRITKIGISYFWIKIFPIKNEKSLEDFFINRFGKQLYLTFFKDYTQKVWGVPCTEIKPEWGAQRIKGLSVTKVLLNAIGSIIKKDNSIDQKNKETSLIEQFLYPKFGPGQMWEETARLIIEMGGEIIYQKKVNKIEIDNNQITSIEVEDRNNGSKEMFKGEYFFSTMPVKDLVNGMQTEIPNNVNTVANGLIYRDFITVGLLLNKLKIKNNTKFQTHNNLIPDCWIYIQEKDVKLGRLQIFNNWSPFMVKNKDHVWMGLEYFCNEGDELWSKSDDEFYQFAIDELAKIDVIEKEDVIDGLVIRMPKTYPAYFGTYDEFDVVRNYLDQFENLFLIGRNGMHKYNNQDHSMLTAMAAVDNIANNIKTKENIWNINTEQEYHESK
jgi:protoporphyrinogen oxidase